MKKSKKPQKRFTKKYKKQTAIIVIGTMAVMTVLVVVNIWILYKNSKIPVKQVEGPMIMEDFLTPNEFSRSRKPIGEVKSIVIHYVANPGSSAKNNRDYFENLKDTGATYASSHYIVGLEGEIIQCVPLNEVAYASNHRNSDTISIESCHPDSSGKFLFETYDSLVQLIAWLCGEYNIKPDKIIRHYDITGKLCPKYYVENPEAWEQLKKDVASYIKEHEISNEKK